MAQKAMKVSRLALLSAISSFCNGISDVLIDDPKEIWDWGTGRACGEQRNERRELLME
jgi:hypothetical protein